MNLINLPVSALSTESPALPTTFHAERARVTVVTRYRDPDDPELIAARRRMNEEHLVDAISKVLAKAPPMTPAVCDRIIALLVTSEVAEQARRCLPSRWFS